jgi:hypothetical protein
MQQPGITGASSSLNIVVASKATTGFPEVLPMKVLSFASSLHSTNNTGFTNIYI